MGGGGARRSHTAALLLGVLFFGGMASEPQAASRACGRLQDELAVASRGAGGGPALIRKYDAAIDRQREQIAKVRSRSERAGCFFSLFGRQANECASLDATIDRMNANLYALQGKRQRLAAGGSRRDRARILASLDANGCGNEVPPGQAPLREAARDDGGTNLLDQLFGGDSRQIDPSEQAADAGEERNARRMLIGPGILEPARGEFHTSCVRTCDGYFFPMSNAASLGDFERDQKNCESSCPGTEMQVFYSRGMGDSASMTSSVTGRPYSEMPTAYLYKRSDMSRPPACGCNAAQNFEVIAGNPLHPERSAPLADATPSITEPATYADPAAGAQTLAEMNGGLDPAAIKQLSAEPVTSPAALLPPEQRKVRVVGPTFLPDPSAAIDLQAPALKAVR